jgi:hypothetical protein
LRRYDGWNDVGDNTEMFPIGMIHGARYKGGDVKLDGRYAARMYGFQ